MQDSSPADLFEDSVTNDLLAPRIPLYRYMQTDEIPSLSRDDGLYLSSDQAAYQRQMRLEEKTVSLAVERYKKMSADAADRGDVVTHRGASELLHAWFNPLTLAIQQEQQKNRKPHGAVTEGVTSAETESQNGIGRFDMNKEFSSLVNRLSADAIAVITIQSVLGSLMREATGVPLTRLAISIASTIRAETNMKEIGSLQRKQEKLESRGSRTTPDDSARGSQKRSLDAKKVLKNAMKSSSSLVSAVNYAARQLAIRDDMWTNRELLLLGTGLINIMMKVAKVDDGQGAFVPALQHFKKFRKSGMINVGMLQLTDKAFSSIDLSDRDLYMPISPKQQPMLVPPRPWISPKNGAYLKSNSHLIRTAPSGHKELDSALAGSDLSTLYQGLNALGEQSWCVNKNVLDAATDLWDGGGGVAGLVTKTDCDVPKREEFIEIEMKAFAEKKKELEAHRLKGEVEDDDAYLFDEKRAMKKLRHARRKAQKLNRELVSIRADTHHRIELARSFACEDRIWLPHNVDFRGRAYPIPVHLQHMGCDLTRALLSFAKPGVELGPRGLYWLKVHLANLLGGDKLSFDERVDMAEDSLSRAIEVGRDPLSESNMEFWSGAEDPFQLLAACSEISAAAGRRGGEKAMENFKSSLPISMDGSCNGLQHYAALGRDVAGGVQVNLVPNSRPQDVYTGIATLVGEKVDKLAEDGDEICRLLQGKISRKVVKQTVMTSVYGVTLIGAREQIQNRIAEIKGFPEDKLFPASMKLASLTLTSLGDIFAGASRTMDWLGDSAQKISSRGHEVQWMTPIGLPVIQPYRRSERVIVRTMMQRVTLESQGGHMPVSSARQKSAFPPNFVHSIDSAHMLLTGITCNKEGLSFAAVHDSFWTNAAYVDRMNEVLRDEFIRLHQRDLLAELRESFHMRFPELQFQDIPPRGKLDLEVVRESPYFFS